jgi:catechol 2,3-dioxygenase-like lactoylglutathione lyase family enzyme
MSEVGFDLNQITLPVVDLEQAIDFYTRFGLKVIVDSPETQYARFEIPGSEATLSLHLASKRVSAPSADIYFEASNPEEVVARLRSVGIEPELPLEDKPWLWREAWYVDPSGNRLCVYFAGENRKNPPWRVQ